MRPVHGVAVPLGDQIVQGVVTLHVRGVVHVLLVLVLLHHRADAPLPRRLRDHGRGRCRCLHAGDLPSQRLARLARLIRCELRHRLRALSLLYAHPLNALALGLQLLTLLRLRATVAPAALLRHRLPAVVEDEHARGSVAVLQRREPRLDARRVDGAVEGVPRAPTELVELLGRLLLRTHAKGAQPLGGRA